MTLERLKREFPERTRCSVTGDIPISYVNENLEEIAKIVKENNLRRIYRGPRPYTSTQSMTHKSDALAMKLYNRWYASNRN